MQTDYFLHTALALWSLVIGMFLCSVYDIFRIFRLRRNQSNVLLFFSDIAFCAVATVSMLLLFFNLSYGRMRAYAFVLVPIGFLIWRFTVGKVVFGLMLKIISLAETLITSIKMRIISAMSRFICRIYTSYYCKKTLFGIKKRKGLKNEQENTDTH